MGANQLVQVGINACEQLGIKPENCIAVEDAPNGVKSAYRAGCNVIMVPDLTEPDEELSKYLHARVDSLADILQFPTRSATIKN